MIRVPDLATQRRETDEPASVGDTLVDLISGLTIMLFVIAVGFWTVGVFG